MLLFDLANHTIACPTCTTPISTDLWSTHMLSHQPINSSPIVNKPTESAHNSPERFLPNTSVAKPKGNAYVEGPAERFYGDGYSSPPSTPPPAADVDKIHVTLAAAANDIDDEGMAEWLRGKGRRCMGCFLLGRNKKRVGDFAFCTKCSTSWGRARGCEIFPSFVRFRQGLKFDKNSGVNYSCGLPMVLCRGHNYREDVCDFDDVVKPLLFAIAMTDGIVEDLQHRMLCPEGTNLLDWINGTFNEVDGVSIHWQIIKIVLVENAL